MIKYLGSKRTLLPVLKSLLQASGARTAIDLFTGSTRVAVAMKQIGMQVIAVDSASYSEVLSKTFIEINGTPKMQAELEDQIHYLRNIPSEPGYFTEVFCKKARFFRPANGERIDSIRERIESDYQGSWLYHPLLASLLIAADKVDSTTGVQMAYLKNWSRRSGAQLDLQVPQLLRGSGTALRADANEIVKELPQVDIAYLDPPYNQHRYFGNYHIWETLIRWDKPDYYGVANKRLDTRSDQNKSAFNSKKTMPAALSDVISNLKAETLILSYNNESWLSRKDLIDICSGYEIGRAHV